MRALVFSSLLLFCLNTTLTIFIMCGANMATEGLPLRREERGVDSEDILAGADFLSVFMKSSMRRDYSETTSPSVVTTVTPGEDAARNAYEENYVGPSRNTVTFAQPSSGGFSVSERNPRVDSSNDISDGVVLAVSISSSVGKMINKELHESNAVTEITESEAVTVAPTTILDQSYAASEEHPSIISKVSKSELNVEESEPITQERDVDFTEYPARVRSLPSKQHTAFDPTTAFLNQNLNSDGKQPFRQTLIYHNSPESPGRARSVSYSTVIQALPHLPEEIEKSTQERRERNYSGAQPYINHFTNNNNIKENETNVEATNNSYDSANSHKPWQPPVKSIITTERNWETQEKPYVPPTQPPAQLPIVYGQPEQNYEVDESVSVVTNGRAHGVQPSLPPKPNLKVKKLDDNQKVGYVVEGRNYRKYRVEERTADGFIVGEYGVVSHDDGSLRGVRYTADGTINPRVISEALMKFLSL